MYPAFSRLTQTESIAYHPNTFHKLVTMYRNFGFGTLGGARQRLRRRAPNQNLTLNLYREILKNLSFSIWPILGMQHFRWEVS